MMHTSSHHLPDHLLQRIIDTSFTMCDDASSRQILACRLLCTDPSLERFAMPSIVTSPICISDSDNYDEWNIWTSFKSWISRYHNKIQGLDFHGDHDAFHELISIISSSTTIRALRIHFAPERPCSASGSEECTLGFLGYAMDGSPRSDRDGCAYMMKPLAYRTIDRIVKKSSSFRPLMDRRHPLRAVQIINMQRRRQHFQNAPLPINIQHLSLVGCVVTSPLPLTLLSLSMDRVTFSSDAFRLPSSLRTLRITGALIELGGRLFDVVDMNSCGRLDQLTHFEWHGNSAIDPDRWPKFNFEIIASPRLVHFKSSYITIQNLTSSTLGRCTGLETLLIPNGLHIDEENNNANLIFPPTTNHVDLHGAMSYINADTFKNVPKLHTLRLSGVHRDIDLTRLNIWNSLCTLVVPALTIDQVFPNDCITPRTKSGIPILTVHIPIDPIEMDDIDEVETFVVKISRIGNLLTRLLMYPDECEDVSAYYILAEEIKEMMHLRFPHIHIEICDDPFCTS